ncbi:MAG: hypothetical protein HYV63_10155 [Candidatus Schekmanbacteria bacterium]|nr:hypothetical protein [Candidatus Schekmanbacteria bacterium]
MTSSSRIGIAVLSVLLGVAAGAGGDAPAGAAADLAVQLEAPTIDAPGPFTIDFLVTNRGDVAGSTSLAYDLATTGAGSRTITVPAGEAQLVSLTDELFQERAYHFAFSGDFAADYDLELAPFFVAWVSFFPDDFAPLLPGDEGVSLPVELTCLRRHCDFALVAKLTDLAGGAKFAASRAMTMSPGEVERTTVTVPAPAADYALSWHLEAGGGDAYFPSALAGKVLLVRPRRSVALEAETVCETCARTPGAATARLGITSLGTEPCTGRVEVRTSGGELVHAEEVGPLATGDAVSIGIPIDLAEQPDDLVTFPVTVFDTTGDTVATASLSYEISDAALRVTQVPDAAVATPEAPLALTFAAENRGDRGAELVATVTIDEAGTQEGRAAVAPGETAEVSVELLFPADMPPGTYHGFYELAVAGGPLLRQGTVAVEVVSSGLTVVASLDQAAYTAGESAVVTLALTADAGGVLPDVVARAQYGTTAVSSAIAGGGAAAEAVLAVPLGELTEERIAYGVHFPDGRALWLGTLPIRAATAEGWSVRALTDVVAPGGELSVRVEAEAGTTYTLAAFGETVSGSLSGSAATTEAIPVPADFPQGTYGVAYELGFPAGGTASGAWPFDVAGTYLRVERQESDRESASALASPAARRAAGSSYAPGDRVEMRLLFVSSAAVADAALHAWVQAPGGPTFAVVEDQPFAIPSGGEEVPVEETLVFAMPETGAAGPHRVVYQVITGSGVLLTTGEEIVDLIGITPISAALELADYPLATEAVRVLVEAIVHGSGTVEVWEGDALLATAAVSGEGEQEIALDLPALAPGEHLLRIVFVSGSHREERTLILRYGTALPDLSVSLAVSAPAFAAGGAVSESAAAVLAVHNAGAGDAEAAELVLAMALAADGGGEEELARLPVPALASGETASWQVELALPVDAAARELTATVTPGEATLDGSAANDTSSAFWAVPLAPELAVDWVDAGNPWAGLAASWPADAGDAGPATYLAAVLRVEADGSLAEVLPEQSFGGSTEAEVDQVDWEMGRSYRLVARARNALGFAGPPAMSAAIAVPRLPVPLAPASAALLVGLAVSVAAWWRRRRG